jgi:hypothetical protein
MPPPLVLRFEDALVRRDILLEFGSKIHIITSQALVVQVWTSDYNRRPVLNAPTATGASFFSNKSLLFPWVTPLATVQYQLPIGLKYFMTTAEYPGVLRDPWR